MSNKAFAPIAIAEEYWAGSHLSIARYYGGVTFNGHEYEIVNKYGITIFQLSNPGSKHYVGDGAKKAIEPGEPADLVRKDFITYYRRLGRDRFLDVLKEHQQASDKELKKIYKEIAGTPDTTTRIKKTSKPKKLSCKLKEKYKGCTQCSMCDCAGFTPSECESHFAIRHGATCREIDYQLMKQDVETKKKK